MSYFLDAAVKAIRLLVSLDSETYGIIFLSLKVCGVSVVLGALLGVPLGMLIALRQFPFKGFVVNVIQTLMGVPPVVVGLIVYILLSNQMGLFGDLRLLFSDTAMIIAQVMLAVPIICGLTIMAIHEMDDTIRRTAISLGATPVQTLICIVGEARYSLVSAVIVTFGRLMAEVGAVMMVGGNIRFQTRVMTTAIAMHKGMGEFEEALALGIVLLLVSFLINLILSGFRTTKEAAR